MNLKRKFLKGGTVLGVTHLAGQLCSLGRNIIIARMISPADFGVAAIFAMTVAFLDMISNLSLDRLLVQAPDGDNVLFQRVAHFLQVIRGGVCCVLLAVFSGIIARLFSIPEAQAAFYVLAVIPLVKGASHLDPRRVERDMQFWPNASVEFISHCLVLILAWPLANFFHNYWAMLYLLLIRAIIYAVGTHIVAKRKYTWARDAHYVSRFFSFGWPLLANGLLMFAILQGDRFVLASARKVFDVRYDMTDVGVYSAAFIIAMMPANICIKIISSLILPVLSKDQNRNKSFNEKAHLVSQALTVIAVAFGSVMLLAGEELLLFVYGESYRVSSYLLVWISVLWTIRIVRVSPAALAMALGNTKVLMQTNLVRFVSLFGVVAVVWSELDISWIAAVGAIGEVVAYVFALLLNKKVLSIPLSISLRPSLILLLCVLTVMTCREFAIDQLAGFGWGLYVVIFSVFLPLLAVNLLPELKSKILVSVRVS